MKISLFKTLRVVNGIRKLISDYVKFRKPYSDKGWELSDSEKTELGNKAFNVVENILNLLIK